MPVFKSWHKEKKHFNIKQGYIWKNWLGDSTVPRQHKKRIQTAQNIWLEISPVISEKEWKINTKLILYRISYMQLYALNVSLYIYNMLIVCIDIYTYKSMFLYIWDWLFYEID